MNHDDDDTDTLIAVVSSLLPNVIPSTDILDALVKCDGDVQATVQLLINKKLKRKGTLDDWLHRPSKSRLAAPSKVTLPPLLLSTPDSVAQNTPCTLHLSVLPPELAGKLFYTMLSASRGWKKNKWWLVDRLVESPHRTAFFARKIDGDSSESWQEAAQFWCDNSPLTSLAILRVYDCDYI